MPCNLPYGRCAQIQIQRRMDKIRNEEVRNKTNVVDVGYVINEKKFKYAGHLIRKEK